MDYLKDLEKIININSYTKNKNGVDEVGIIMTNWLRELGFSLLTYKRENIGNHLLFFYTYKNWKKNTIFRPQ